MKTHARFYGLWAIILVLVAGCSSLPGLRVLSGQDSADALAERALETSELVMADKSGTTDPSMLIAADRIEAANSGNVDIIEIRQDLSKSVLNVYLLFTINNPNATDQDQSNAIKRAVELTWQGVRDISRSSTVIRINFMRPVPVPTLNSGVSFAGQISGVFEISRAEALAYLGRRPNNFADFINLIAQGKLNYQPPDQSQPQYYEGTPNHTMFMLSALEAQVRAVQQGQNQNAGQ
jgi:hypothetical protein